MEIFGAAATTLIVLTQDVSLQDKFQRTISSHHIDLSGDDVAGRKSGTRGQTPCPIVGENVLADDGDWRWGKAFWRSAKV